MVTVSSSYRCRSLSDFLGGVLSWNRVRRERGRAREPGGREERKGGQGGERDSGFGQELSAVGQEPHNNTIARYDYYCVS